jgi:aryl-alcohol dehydrogenase-like predicted oxidoreductase
MHESLDRREFLRRSLAVGAGVALPASLAASMRSHADGSRASRAEPDWRNRQAGMKYRRLGRTGFMISEIVCGGDPVTPDNHRHVEVAVERGLNYLDTAPAYGQGKSEAGYAEVLRAVGRDKVFLNTKVSPLGNARNRAYQEIFVALSRAEQEAVLKEVAEDLRKRDATLPDYMGNYFGGQLREIEADALSDVLERKYRAKIDGRATYAETMIRSVEESLKRLKTDHVDILMCPHGASSYAETQIPEIHETFEKLRDQGKVRALGVSAHNDPAGVLRGAIASGVYSVAMIAFNITNRSYLEPALEEAKKADFGVIAMKVAQAVFDPDRSTNRRSERVALLDRLVPGDQLNTYQKAYTFGLSNPNLTAVISNMVNEQQMTENLSVISG